MNTTIIITVIRLIFNYLFFNHNPNSLNPLAAYSKCSITCEVTETSVWSVVIVRGMGGQNVPMTAVWPGKCTH